MACGSGRRQPDHPSAASKTPPTSAWLQSGPCAPGRTLPGSGDDDEWWLLGPCNGITCYFGQFDHGRLLSVRCYRPPVLHKKSKQGHRNKTSGKQQGPAGWRGLACALGTHRWGLLWPQGRRRLRHGNERGPREPGRHRPADSKAGSRVRRSAPCDIIFLVTQ